MIHKYSDFLNLIAEGSESKPTMIYWDYQLDKLLNENWIQISTQNFNVKKAYTEVKAQGKYSIKFRTDNAENGYYSVIVEQKGNDDILYLESSEKFIKKFTDEFYKNAVENIKKLKYEPKFLGDLEHIKMSGKYNIG